MDATASIITVVKTSLSLAQYIGQLIQDVRQQDANAEELEFRLESLTRALGEATSAYGPQGNNSSSSSNEDQLRQDVRRIVIDYKGDLERVGTELKKQIRLGNWLKLAWRKQHAALTLAKIEKSISERQKQLGFLVQLLHGQELRDMNAKLEALTKIYYPDYPLSTTTSRTLVPTADSDASHDEAQSGDTRLGSHGNLETQESVASQEDRESSANGVLLLEAIRDPDNDNFESLFLDGNTSFQEKDDRDRTPLLLAASLDMKDIVRKFLADDTLFSPPNSTGAAEDTKTTNLREIDVNARDTLGRSTLHYCAEFDMCDEAKTLMNHGVDVNARDNSDCPPAYYAAKNRNDKVLELLLERGADTRFELQEPTSFKITSC